MSPDPNLKPAGYLGSSVLPLDGTVRNLPGPATGTVVRRAVLQPQGANMRYRPGNTDDAAAGVGFRQYDGQLLELTSTAEVYSFRYVAESGSGVLEVAWYGGGTQ